tara:strand:- start:205 stop:1302 length:1098 start_codon:yes stop_codon:yes gene_type:complete
VTELINPLLLFTAQVVSILSVLLLATGYFKTDPSSTSSKIFAALSIFVVFYLLGGMDANHINPQFRLNLEPWRVLINFGVSAIPGLFMVYCFLIFQEGEKFPTPLGIAFSLQVFADFIVDSMRRVDDPFIGSNFFNWSIVAMDILQLVFVAFAIYWTIKGWRADLVADRRILRWFIIGLQGALIFSVVFLENFWLVGGSESNAVGQAIIVFSLALLTLCMLVVALRFDLVSLSDAIRKVAESASDSSQAPLSFDGGSFDTAFRIGQLYREAGLTISTLAQKLSVPEYRLRSFIHKQLGFRNFNAMLHQYRVEDASELLIDNDKKTVPVLTIALTVGYQSITPFNNAFRRIKGVTPSEYRKEHLMR